MAADPLSRSTPAPRYGLARYWEAVQEPLYALAFITPLVVLHETLIFLGYGSAQALRELVAHSLLRQMLAGLAGGAHWVPGAALVAVLAVWHWLAGPRRKFQPSYLLLMAVESVVAALPLLVIGRLLAAGDSSPGSILALALAAGLFEELLFRLILTGGLAALFAALLGRRSVVTIAAAALISGWIFAICHFAPIGQQAFSVDEFWRFVLAGAYLALVFVGRGLGVAVGCHVAYDLAVLIGRPA
jgi:membrane protease YdiL (CAAX protease family)